MHKEWSPISLGARNREHSTTESGDRRLEGPEWYVDGYPQILKQISNWVAEGTFVGWALAENAMQTGLAAVREMGQLQQEFNENGLKRAEMFANWLNVLFAAQASLRYHCDMYSRTPEGGFYENGLFNQLVGYNGEVIVGGKSCPLLLHFLQGLEISIPQLPSLSDYPIDPSLHRDILQFNRLAIGSANELRAAGVVTGLPPILCPTTRIRVENRPQNHGVESLPTESQSVASYFERAQDVLAFPFAVQQVGLGIDIAPSVGDRTIDPLMQGLRMLRLMYHVGANSQPGTAPVAYIDSSRSGGLHLQVSAVGEPPVRNLAAFSALYKDPLFTSCNPNGQGGVDFDLRL